MGESALFRNTGRAREARPRRSDFAHRVRMRATCRQPDLHAKFRDLPSALAKLSQQGINLIAVGCAKGADIASQAAAFPRGAGRVRGTIFPTRETPGVLLIMREPAHIGAAR